MFLYLESAYYLLKFKSVNAYNYIVEFTLYLINEQTLWSFAKFWTDKLLQR